MKIRSEKGNNQSKDLRIIETSLVPCSPAIRPDLFKKQILMLNESKLITEIMSDHREIKSIVRISREDPELILDEISLLIIGVQNFLDTKRKMDENGIVEVAGLILSEYPFLTLYEIAFCFKHGKIGKYGKIYDRLDGGILMEWIQKWDQRRTDLVVSEQERISNSFKDPGATRTSDKSLRSYLKKGRS